MSLIAIVVIVVIVLPVFFWALWMIIQDIRVWIETGTVGLVVIRGIATDNVLEPGGHLLRPNRRRIVEMYPLRELTYLAGPGDVPRESDINDPPLDLYLGDRTAATVRYTLRFRIVPTGLPEIHERWGPLGFPSQIRDRSRAVLFASFGESSITYADVFGDARAALEAKLAAQLGEALKEDGFELVLFTLREVDLGEIGRTIQDAAAGRAELEREEAAAAVRLARVRNENQINEQLVGAGLGEEVLRYRQIELWREYVQRWDGHAVAPPPGAAAAAAARAGAAAPAAIAAPDPGGTDVVSEQTEQPS